MSGYITPEVAKLIQAEREYQDKKWGTLEEHPHEVGAWLTILRLELQEAEEAWVSNEGDRMALAEIVQVCAVAWACLEQHGGGAYLLQLANRTARLNDAY